MNEPVVDASVVGNDPVPFDIQPAAGDKWSTIRRVATAVIVALGNKCDAASWHREKRVDRSAIEILIFVRNVDGHLAAGCDETSSGRRHAGQHMADGPQVAGFVIEYCAGDCCCSRAIPAQDYACTVKGCAECRTDSAWQNENIQPQTIVATECAVWMVAKKVFAGIYRVGPSYRGG